MSAGYATEATSRYVNSMTAWLGYVIMVANDANSYNKLRSKKVN